MTEVNELTLDANIDNLADVIDFINENLSRYGCSMKVQMTVDIAVEEIYVNIAHYAYPNGIGSVKIIFKCSFETDDKGKISITFIDSGIPYNPFEKDDPNVTLSADDRNIGGLGIYIVKKSMDEIEYEYRYKEKYNVLTIKKYL